MTWKAGGETTLRGYKFTYDGLNRLSVAAYGEGSTITVNDRYTEKITGYTKNGSITALQRSGKTNSGSYGLIDNLNLAYNGNQLKAVSDAAVDPTYVGAFNFVNGANNTTEYAYDANGNLTRDDNKKITVIAYNYLNLPQQITFSNGNKVVYLYDADGVKRQAVYTIAGTSKKIDYCGNMVHTDGVMTQVLNAQGYATFSGTNPIYHYYLKDHLGNNRVVVSSSGATEQTTHYYAFGGVFGDTGTNADLQRYKYNGKEFDRMNALDLYDYGARNYDPALAMWTTQDPMSEKYYSDSPYAYCINNPIRFIDPVGKDIWEINSQGEIINRIKDKTQDAFYMVAQEADGNYQRTFMTDAEGNKKYNSISFKYGTVESQKNISTSSTNSYDVYRVRGDANSTSFFEFMATNTTVEWSQSKTGIQGDKGLNFATTSHEQTTERGMSYLYSGQLYSGYTIREMNHSHPNNTAYPSGSFAHPSTGAAVGDWGDVGFSRSITNNRQTNRLNVPTFNIYLPASKSYINYGISSTRSHYGR